MNNNLIEGCSALIGRVLGLFIRAWLVMLLWNALMPFIFSVLPELTYWQSFGILLLSNFLFNDNGTIVLMLQNINKKLVS